MKIHDKILIIISIIFSCMGYVLFKRTVPVFSSTSVQSKIIASVNSYKNDVKIKFNNSLFWQVINTNLKINNGDSILALSDSEIEIDFLSNARLKIGPNSLIRIFEVNKQKELQVTRGRITFKNNQSNGNTEKEILVNGHTIKAKSKLIELDIQKTDKKTFVRVQKGNIEVLNKGKRTPVKTNDELNLETDSLSQVQLQEPLNLSYEYSEIEKGIQFKWKYASGQRKSFLMISNTPTFDSILHKVETDKNSYLMKNIISGHYFWKVENPSDDQKSSIGEFTVKSSAPPIILSPKTQAKFELDRNRNTIINFSWTSDAPPPYVLKINNITKNTFQEFTANKNSIDIVLGKYGKYTWKVKSSEHGANYSAIQLIEILPQNEFDSSPTANIAYISPLKKDVTFQWLGHKREKVLFKLYDNKSQEIKSESILFDKFVIKNLKRGIYQWQVALNDYPQIKSKLKEIIVKEKAASVIFPDNNESVVESKIASGITLKWKDEGLKKKRIIIARDEKFKQLVLNKNITLNELSFNPDNQGHYYWKVLSDSDDEHIVPSDVFSFNYHPKVLNPINLPDIYFLKLDKTGNKETYYLDWPSPANAHIYEVEVFQDKDMKRLKSTRQFKKEKMVWNYEGSGVFYARIRYEDKVGDKSPFSKLSKIVYPISPFEN